jgi:hypothetical protein
MKKIPPEIAKNFVLTSFSALSILAVAPAQAVILDFQDLERINVGANFVGSTYSKDGFTLVAPASIPFFNYGTQTTSLYAGSTALLAWGAQDSVYRLTQDNGGVFTLSSIDLGNTFLTTPTRTVTFTGLRADNSTVTQDFTTDPDVINLRNFNFSNFTNLVSVDFVGDGVSQYYQFDNINVSPTVSAAVPEPFSILGTIFGAGSGVALKRKLSKDRQAKNQIA